MGQQLRAKQHDGVVRVRALEATVRSLSHKSVAHAETARLGGEVGAMIPTEWSQPALLDPPSLAARLTSGVFLPLSLSWLGCGRWARCVAPRRG